ncbi:MAG: GDP-mannose 4,6-dehydratase [Sphingobacteriaceae bacterium]|nr:GDP-mannose 4,6-dehydratase [Sphingobacteriaceae bacterium]
MNILITGVAGFIGSSLAEKLVELGHSVFGVDNFDTFYKKETKLSNLHNLMQSANFTFLEGDICNKELYKNKIFKHIDIVVHLAARAGVRPSLEIPDKYYESNAIGTIELLEFAKREKIKRFIFASSSSVYGKNPNSPWKEDSELMPISPYAASKISAESIGKVYAHLYNIQFIALRFFTVYGPKQRPDLAIHKFFHKIYNDQAIDFYGDGKTYRDYTYIDDIIHGLIGALFSEELNENFMCFNLGNNKQISLAELVTNIEKIIGKKAILNYLPEQQGDVRSTCADINNSAKYLKYNPKTAIEEGLQSFNKWYLTQNKIN